MLHDRYRIKAFTLVETSIVLIIIGLISATVFPALTAVQKNFQITATRNNLQTLLKVISAYTQSRGCLPCPTPANVNGSRFGKIGGLDSPPACGVCNSPEGIAPYISLGIPASLAKDGWGNWITLRIDPKLAENPTTIVPPTAPCTNADVLGGICTIFGASQKGMCKANLSVSNTHPIIQAQGSAPQNVAIVLVSHGANGYGSFIASAMEPTSPIIKRKKVPDNTTPSCANGPEACNASYTRYFLEAEAGDSYDDLMTYMDRNALISLSGQNGCQTSW